MAHYLFLSVFCNDKDYWKQDICTNYTWNFLNFSAEGSVKDIIEYFRYRTVDNSEIRYMLSHLSKDEKEYNNSISGPVKNGSNCFIVRCPKCSKLHSVSAQRVLNDGSLLCTDCKRVIKNIETYGSLSDNIRGIEKYWVFDENIETPDTIPFNNSNNDSNYVLICPSCGIKHSKRKTSILDSKSILCKSCSSSKGQIKVKEGYSLYDEYPVVAKYFDGAGNGISSKEVYPNSNKKYKFKCPEGHIFESTPDSMVRFETINSKYKGCPYCSGRKVDKGLSFGTLCPNVSSLWDYKKNKGISPYDVQRGSGKKYWFRCRRGHSFLASPNSISRAENSPYLGCSACRNELTEGFNDLVSKEPNIVEYWDDKNDKKPNEVKYDPSNSNKTLYWVHCDKGHLYQQSACKIIKSFKNGIKGCPVCSGQLLQNGVNDLATLRPDVAKYWDYDKNSTTPTDVTPYSHRDAWFKCINCGDSFCIPIKDRSKSAGYCNYCASHFNQSLAEKEIINWLRGLGYNVKTDLTLGDRNYKYDIYIPEKNMVIEYNGIYYHSELKHEDRYYHYNKYMCCKKKGISFIAIWEDDYKRSSSFIKKSVLRKLGDSEEDKINARDCGIYDCSKIEAYEFLSENHIQGFVNMSSYIALRDSNGSIVAILAYTFSRGVLFIKRYATSCIVRGGFSKLLKYLEDTLNPSIVETFSDNGVSDGGLYNNLGFKPIKDISPDYSYVYHGGRRIHKFNMRKKNFEKDLNLYYNPNFTESELAEVNGLYKIWDYGKVKWVKYLS